jgi:hypothetical protein
MTGSGVENLLIIESRSLCPPPIFWVFAFPCFFQLKSEKRKKAVNKFVDNSKNLLKSITYMIKTDCKPRGKVLWVRVEQENAG